ncbi:Cullin-domain-containing protein [Trichodelitschia bisporula]|uniref:Cullin-domain-containing protein n=1 Tax=Trichodelitschia bisporula TaxID=703511 RepID=A0A6G1HLN9_9PEZI|nr:Cullin-domain-containing protein [Trichodelitschia bisporula]
MQGAPTPSTLHAGRSKKRQLNDQQQSIPSLFSSPIQEHSKRPKTQPACVQADDMYSFATRDVPPPKARLPPGARRIVIKNLRPTREPDTRAYFLQTWTRLEAAVRSVFANAPLPCSMEELYRAAENICRQGLASELADRLEAALRACAQIPAQTLAGAGIEYLRTLQPAWTRWSKQMNTIQAIFYFLDRSYLLHSTRPCVQQMGVDMFRDIVDNPKGIRQCVDGACQLLQAQREGTCDEELFRSVVAMFQALRIYDQIEGPLLRASAEYITPWAEAAARAPLAEYVARASDLMTSEMDRCKAVGLPEATQKALWSLLEDHLIERHSETLADIGRLLDARDAAALEKVYALLARRQLTKLLRPRFVAWIDRTGTAIVFADDEDMVRKLLLLKQQLDDIWETAFKRDPDLGHALRQTFHTFINKTKKSDMTWGTDNSKPGEMIAKYLDALLRGGAKAVPGEFAHGSETEQVDAQLDQVLDLFRFLDGKAVFETFYRNDLARRLLMGRSASADAERSMLARLKTECGGSFTQNLEQMFKDVELAREELANYKDRQPKSAVDFSVNILAASAWPSYPDVAVNIPPEVKTEMDRFEEHYRSKHQGRKLEWKNTLAHCQLRAHFPSGRKELVVSGFQAIVLLQFNGVSEQRLPYTRLKAETGLPDADLKRTLQSLACGKVRPLRKHPACRDIDDSDTFDFNAGFTHEKYRVKINQVQLRETKEENKLTHERVMMDRNYETQAAIVRIMKSKQTVVHAVLVAEVIEATRKRGVLAIEDIKKNIDKLIDKDYMEREDGKYTYIA